MPVARPRRRAGGRGERARREDAPRIAARHPVAGERAQEGGEEPEEGGGGRRGPARAAELLEEGGGENGGGVGGPRREEQGGKGEPETRVGERLPIGRHPAIIDNPVAVSKDSRGYMGAKYIGAGGKRREDPRPLRGRGTYVDALKLPGLLHAAVVRSPHAHARLGAIRADAALRLPGVVAVFAFDDLKAWLKPLPVSGMPPPALQARVGFSLRVAAQLLLASGTVRYAGEPVALVVAESRYVAEDAGALVAVDYEPLPLG